MSAVQLSHLRELRDGWDSYGGKPPTKKALETAEIIQFVPVPDGGIQIELNTAAAWFEIAINPDGEIEDCTWGPKR